MSARASAKLPTSSTTSRKQLAAAEAAVLRTALAARSSGHLRPAESTVTGGPAPMGGSDLEEELRWFVDVARAFVQSPPLTTA
ncbi:DUF6545 domain-containing protein [Streptomyces sp. NPDC004012]